MTRAQLIRLLASAVAASWITVAQATQIRQQVDAGEDLDLPLPPEQAIQRPTVEQAAAALGVVAAWLNLSRTTITQVITQRRPLTRDQLQDAFAARARVAALLPVPDWHAAMRDSVRDHLLAQYALGLGRPLAAVDLRAVEGDVLTQLGYLSRFADEWAVRALSGQPMSDAMVAARGELYSGAGRSAYFRGSEQRLGDGWIIRYESQDDGGVCSPCLAAEQRGPYLPGSGPYPASVCLGRGHCRCVRREVFDPAGYRRLVGSA